MPHISVALAAAHVTASSEAGEKGLATVLDTRDRDSGRGRLELLERRDADARAEVCVHVDETG
jgi:hypothetical protein